MTYSNGDVYKGEFKAGKKEGRGKLTLANGDIYDGEFKADMKEGHGTYQKHPTSANAAIEKYEGEWKGNVKQKSPAPSPSL